MAIFPMELVGENLKRLRRDAELSAQQMGAVLDVSYQQIHKYESGENQLPLSKLVILKHAFDLSYEYFFEGLECQMGSSEKFFFRDPLSSNVMRKLNDIRDHNFRQKILKTIDVLIN